MKLPDLKKAMDEAPVLSPGLPEIIFTERHVHQVATDALDSLVKQNRPHPSLFLNGHTLVRLKRGNIQPFTTDMLTYQLNRSAIWYKKKQNGKPYPQTVRNG